MTLYHPMCHIKHRFCRITLSIGRTKLLLAKVSLKLFYRCRIKYFKCQKFGINDVKDLNLTINFVLTIFKLICHFNKEVAYSNISRLSQQVIFTDLSGAETNYQISNKSILSLTATVRDHHSPASILRHFAPGMRSNKLKSNKIMLTNV